MTSINALASYISKPWGKKSRTFLTTRRTAPNAAGARQEETRQPPGHPGMAPPAPSQIRHARRQIATGGQTSHRIPGTATCSTPRRSVARHRRVPHDPLRDLRHGRAKRLRLSRRHAVVLPARIPVLLKAKGRTLWVRPPFVWVSRFVLGLLSVGRVWARPRSRPTGFRPARTCRPHRRWRRRGPRGLRCGLPSRGPWRSRSGYSAGCSTCGCPRGR
jgi:hypothetical protein